MITITTIVAALMLPFSFASAPPVSEPIPEGYLPIVDDTGTIVVAVPASWIDIDTFPLTDETGAERPYIAASPNVESFLGSFEVPGMLYATFPWTLNPLDLMKNYALTSGCETLTVSEYDDPVFVGVIQVGTNCGPFQMTWNMVVASPADESFTALIQAQSAVPVELETVLRTFNVSSSP